MNFCLEGHVVVITGGAGRIGRAFCEAIAAQQGTAVIADSAAAAAHELASELQERYGAKAAYALPFNITVADELDQAIADLHTRFGRIDALVNNAYPRNSRYGAKLENVSYADFCENVSLHLGGYFISAQRFAAYFVKQGKGNIINLGSIYGIAAPRFDIYAETSMTMPVEYAAIKAGVLHLTRYFAQYFKAKNVRVNSLSPGGVFADQSPEFVRRYSQHVRGGELLAVNDLQGSLIYLLSEASAHVTGQNLVVDDGWTL